MTQPADYGHLRKQHFALWDDITDAIQGAEHGYAYEPFIDVQEAGDFVLGVLARRGLLPNEGTPTDGSAS